MKKFSYVSKKLLKDLGIDLKLPDRVTALETDITRLEGYEETTVKHFVFDIAVSEEQTLKAVLENSEVMDWLCGNHYSEWDHLSIESVANVKPLDGIYNRNGGGNVSTLGRSGDVLKYKQFVAYPGGGILAPAEKTLKANTTTGELSYGTTSLDIATSYSLIHLYFMKGDLK